METLRNLSIVWATAHSALLNALMVIPRVSRRTYVILTSVFAGLIIVVNTILMFTLGVLTVTNLSFLTMSIPSFIYFFFVSKYRDGRLIFIFCVGDILTVVLTAFTAIGGAMLGDNVWFIFFSRLLLFPLVTVLLVRFLSRFYLWVVTEVKKNWWIIAAISVVFYVELELILVKPTAIIQRPEYYPVFLGFCVVIVLTCVMASYIIRDQLLINRYEQTEQLLSMQVRSFENTVRTMERGEKEMRILRHDMRHFENSIRELLAADDVEGALKVLGGLSEATDRTAPKRYCADRTINAILLNYIGRAEELGCKVTARIELADRLPVDTVELCIMLSNALENAVLACGRIPDPQKREIKITCISRPELAIGIYNTYEGTVTMDEDGLPVTHDDYHGYGTQSIRLFAQKHGAVLDFDADGSWFKVRVVFPPEEARP